MRNYGLDLFHDFPTTTQVSNFHAMLGDYEYLTDQDIGYICGSDELDGFLNYVISYSGEFEIDAYWDIISNLSCPVCGSTTEKLNASMTGEVVSVIFFTQYSRKIKVACPHCLDKANEKALIKSVLLGWWGFPWGIIHTIRAINLNLKSKQINHSYSYNDYLRTFIQTSIGELETYKGNKEKLQQILTRQIES